MATSRKEARTSGPGRADSDKPDANSRAYAQAAGSVSGSGAEYKAQTTDGAGCGPAEEWICARGCGMRLLKLQDRGIPDSDVSMG